MAPQILNLVVANTFPCISFEHFRLLSPKRMYMMAGPTGGEPQSSRRRWRRPSQPDSAAPRIWALRRLAIGDPPADGGREAPRPGPAWASPGSGGGGGGTAAPPREGGAAAKDGQGKWRCGRAGERGGGLAIT